MDLPFTAAQFFDVFARYNTSVWPAQVAFAAMGALIAAGAASRHVGRVRAALIALAFLWTWMAAVYLATFFAPINPAAKLFAALFVAEAGAIVWWSVRLHEARRPLRREFVAGALLIAYALIGYPAIGSWIGQDYPAIPTFGVPCPTTIFTFGVFCLFASSLPAALLVVPVLWTMLATIAALRLGVAEDFGLVVAAAVSLTLCVASRTRFHARREVLAS